MTAAVSSPMASPVLTHHIASVVLGWQREGGYGGSSGEDALIAAAFSLDPDTARECLSCPGLLEAVELWRSGGAEALRAAAEVA